MAHVLAADIGNTTARFGLLETAAAVAEGAPKLLSACEVTTRQPITADEARMQLGQILSELTGKASSRGGTCPSPEGSILSCVVPTLTDAWHRALADKLDNDAHDATPVIITGENADAIAALLRHKVTVDDTLTLRGLALIWQANQRG